MAVTAFPYAHWPRISKRDHDLGRRARALLSRAHAEAARVCANRLLGHTPQLTWGPPDRRPPDAADQTGLLLVAADQPDARLLLTGPSAVAWGLSDAMLGGALDEAPPLGEAPLEDLARGALVYLAARCLAVAGGAFHVLDCLPTRERVAAELARLQQPVRYPAALRVGPLRAQLALWFSGDAMLDRTRPGLLIPDSLLSLDVSLAVVAGETCLHHREIMRLAPHDVVLLDRTTVPVARNVAGMGISPETPCTLHLLGDPRPLAQLRVADTGCGLHVVSAAQPLLEKIPPMTDATSHDAPKGPGRQTEALAELPIPLSLELARFRLPVRTLAALAPGDVLASGTPIGQRVTLRAGEQAVATGELVDVDGEIGVRITQVLTAEAPSEPSKTGRDAPGSE